jgi:murein L,D-transpeptidase YcbB/YkuD
MRTFRTLLTITTVAAATWSTATAQLAVETAPPAQRPPLALELNVPAFRIDVLRDTTRIRSFDVAVGTRAYPTPRGEFEISEIVWNPWWTPPPSEWARDDIVMPPGPGNPMGRVKMQLAPSYLIHGTPLEQSIGSAGSHGCVRMRNEDVVALARLLQEASGVPFSDSVVATLLRNRTTRNVTLPVPLPVRIVYRTTEVRADTLLLHPDVYRLHASRVDEAMASLEAAGLDSAGFDRERLVELLNSVRGAAVNTPLDSVMPRADP